jgi:hypothetical protein
MGLPEEDKGPAWLRNWGNSTGHTDSNVFTGYVDPDALSVDIGSLVAFAQALQAEHEQDYRPHVQTVFDQMSATVAPPDARFVELTEGLTHHRDMLVQTSTAIANHDKAVIAFVEAARAISTEYSNADAMSAATVSDVEAGLTNTSVTKNSTGNEVYTPQQAADQTSTPVDGTTNGNNTGTTGNTTGTTADNGQRIS